MERLSYKFGGINTDAYPGRLRSGDADVALNVTLENRRLAKRQGFTEFEDDVDGGATGILKMFCVEFADGDVYVIAKLSAGSATKLFQRKVYPADAGSFAEITGGQTHSATDPGWGFMWYDRFHYFDSVGGTRWNPDVNSGVAFKAGMPRPTTGPIPLVAAGGQKDGRYHFHVAYRNSVTREQGVVTGPQSPALECRLGQTPDISAVTISNWAAIKAADPTYEWDEAIIYCTMGDTEYIAKGPVECFSYIAYVDVVRAKSATTCGAWKADHTLDRREAFTNAGGLPPGSKVGCFTGVRGIYGGLTVNDKIMYSIPFFPTSVPQEVKYNNPLIANDAKTFTPKPWIGEVLPGFGGAQTEIAYGGGIAAAFTPSSTWTFQRDGTGRLYGVKRHPSKGCLCTGAAIGTPAGVFALGNQCLLHLSAGGIVDLADERFATTLAEIPAAYAGLSRLGYYGYADQVWCAVTKTGATKAQRIIVYDMSVGAPVIYEPACLGATGITAMCELAYPGTVPTMLVATDAGQILRYGTTQVADMTTHFACEWQGYFAQERVAQTQLLDAIEIHAGSNCAANVVVKCRPMQMGTDTSDTQTSTTLPANDDLAALKMTAGRVRGRMWQINISTANTVQATWTVHDLAFLAGPVAHATS